MIKADAFASPQAGSAADARFAAIVRSVSNTYEPPREERLPPKLATLVARLRQTDADRRRS